MPGIKETPIPMKGPAVYGPQYLYLFNEYLAGRLSEKHLIDGKNILLTQKTKPQSKQKS